MMVFRSSARPQVMIDSFRLLDEPVGNFYSMEVCSEKDQIQPHVGQVV